MTKSYSSSQIERGLLRKGFVRRNNDHRWLLFAPRGRQTHIKTRVSHGKGKPVGIRLMKKMADQCALNLSDFVNLIDCAISAADYEGRIEAHLAENELPWSRGVRV